MAGLFCDILHSRRKKCRRGFLEERESVPSAKVSRLERSSRWMPRPEAWIRPTFFQPSNARETASRLVFGEIRKLF